MRAHRDTLIIVTMSQGQAPRCQHLLLTGPRKGEECGARSVGLERCEKHWKKYKLQLEKEEEERQARFLKENGITWTEHLQLEAEKRRLIKEERLEAQFQALYGMSRQDYQAEEERKEREKRQAREVEEERKKAEVQAQMSTPGFFERKLEEFCTEALLPEGILTEYLECIQDLYEFRQDSEDEKVVVLRDGRRFRITLKVTEEK
jgi:hypothetical protein